MPTFLNGQDVQTVSKAAVFESVFDVVSPLLTEISMTDDSGLNLSQHKTGDVFKAANGSNVGHVR